MTVIAMRALFTSSKKDKSGLSFLQLMQSVFAALIGIQSEAKRKEDFSKITPKQVFIAGVILTVVFFAIVFGISQTLLAIYT